MSDTIYVGAPYRGRVKVYNRNVTPAVLATPTTLVVTVSPPGAVADSVYSLAGGTITEEATGDFTYIHQCAVAGEHQVESVSTGDYAGVGQSSFTVYPRNV